MPNLKEAALALEEDLNLKMIAQAYTEISALKLKRIRNGIEQNRSFFDTISKVYNLVKYAAVKKNLNLPKKPHNILSLVLTSNHKFYGEIENKLLRFFTVNTSKITTDRIVIGKIGRDFLKGINYSAPFKSVIFQKDIPTDIELKNLVEILNTYNHVLIFYPKFKNMIKQEPTIIDISQAINQQELEKINSELKNFIFEPEINQILNFFNAQMTTLILETAILESELARTATRMLSMDQAQQNAEAIIKNQRKILSSAKRSIDNLRLLETISAFKSLQKRRIT